MLTTTAARSLVGGPPLETGGERMLVRVVRPVLIAGQHVEPGTVVEVDDRIGVQLVSMDKAVLAIDGRETAVATPVRETAVDPLTAEIPQSAKRPRKRTTKK